MAGTFFAEDYNVLLFVIVLGGLTLMMSGCFAYHKWKYKKTKAAAGQIDLDLKLQKKHKSRRRWRAKGSLMYSDDEMQMELNMENKAASARERSNAATVTLTGSQTDHELFTVTSGSPEIATYIRSSIDLEFQPTFSSITHM